MDNPQIDLALRYIELTDCSLFLTGKAGTGKTTFLHHVDRHCQKRHVVVAPTGVAAVNAGGVTIHSFFQLPLDPYLPDVKELVTGYQLPDRHRMSKTKRAIIRTLELLIIDEVSMVRADLLDAIDMTLRRVRRSARPFGGVQLLLIGDLHQLPPVVTERERPYMEQVYPSPFFFNSKALRQVQYYTIELTTVYRQQEQRFVELLNHVRDNRMDAPTLAALNSRVGAPPDDAILLTTHNHTADTVNQSRLDALPTEPRCFSARISGTYPESAYPVPQEMVLKVGQRVMFTRNDPSPAHAYYNGLVATVTAFSDDEEGQTAVEVADDEGRTLRAVPLTWENIRYTIEPRTSAIVPDVEGTFTQYPLRPAWAVTIHKAQGLTFDRVAVDAADAFAFGQVYVALSRCRTLDGLTLTTPLHPDVAFADPHVSGFAETQPTFADAQAALPEAEEQYHFRQLLDLFSVSFLSHQLQRYADLLADGTAPLLSKALAQSGLQATLADLDSVSQRFANQLLRLPRDQHPDRIASAARYYQDQLIHVNQVLAALQRIEVDNHHLATQLQQCMHEMDEALAVKLACLQTVLDQGFSIPAIAHAKIRLAVGDLNQPSGKRKRKEPAAKEPRAAAPKPAPVEAPAPAVDTEALVEALAAWRRAKAAQEHTEAYMVLHQKTLLAIAERAPRTPDQLLAVPGIGRSKAERYGAELLSLVAQATVPATAADTPSPASE